MLKPFHVFFILLLVSCSETSNKTNYLDDFSAFITELQFQKKSDSSINWENKTDSLEMFIKSKDNFRLSAEDENEIEVLLKKFKSLKKSNSNSEMSVNFYFENSGSMNGYLDGKNFKQVIHRIYGNLFQYPVKSYFVNTEEYAQEGILNKIDSKQIEVGNIGDSDHKFIFSNAIENAKKNNLSIVITDAIYSVRDGDVDIVSIALENAFKRSLAKNEIETVVLKLSSNFKGTYYSEKCKPGSKAKKINQNRPYYVVLFGNSQSINKALSEIAVIDELPGFKQQARFFLTKNLKANYTILLRGEEKHGQFKAAKKGSDIMLEIVDAKRFERPGFSGTPKNENYLQFGIAVDFSATGLPNTYKEDLKNYWIDEQLGYTVTSISNVNDIDKTSKTFKEIQRINSKNNTNFTHVIRVKADKNLYGNLHIQLQNNLPAWIDDTGTENDCDTVDEGSTFAFDQLMTGISKAYQNVNDNGQYLDINLKIKP